MATVTMFTLARMLQIERSTIVNAELEGPNLVVIARDGTRHTVGNVQGPIGPQGQDGQVSTSDMTAAINAAIAQHRNVMPWGHVTRRQTANDLTGIGSTSTVIPSLTTTFTHPPNRLLKVSAHIPMFTPDTARRLKTFSLKNGAGTTLAQDRQESTDTSWTFTQSFVLPSTAAAMTLTCGASINVGTCQTNFTAARPGIVIVEDIGPA